MKSDDREAKLSRQEDKHLIYPFASGWQLGTRPISPDFACTRHRLPPRLLPFRFLFMDLLLSAVK